MIIFYVVVVDTTALEEEPYSIFKDLKLKNANRLISVQLNINSIRNKFEQLTNIEILVITEIK